MIGLYKSVDAGQNWQKLVAAPDYCKPQCWKLPLLAVHPLNPNVVFAGRNTGLLRSLDGGATWSDISRGANGVSPHVDHHALAFSADGTKLYELSNGGIYSTTDITNPQVNWKSLNGGLGTAQFYDGISIHPTNVAIGFAGTQDNGTLQSGGALPWNQAGCGDGGWTAIDPVQPNNVYITCQQISIEKST